jgi:hypothetical protein
MLEGSLIISSGMYIENYDSALKKEDYHDTLVWLRSAPHTANPMLSTCLTWQRCDTASLTA